jgi:two-component system, OmpR family, sensor histidine kinase PrrB
MRSLRSRVAFAALAAAAIVVTIAGVGLFVTAGSDERRDLDRRLEAETRALAGLGPFVRGLDELIRERPRGSVAREAARRIEGLVAGSGRVLRVVDDERTVAQLGDVPAKGSFPAGTRPGLRTAEVGGETWRGYSAPAVGSRLSVQIFASVEDIERRAVARRRATVVLGAAALIVTVLLGLLFGRMATRPLSRLRDAAARVRSTSDLGERVPASGGPEEVESLAGSLNEMLARLEGSAGETQAALAASRRFAADAGHELRTPLTGLRTNVDTLTRNADMPESDRRRLAASVRAEVQRLAATLTALQELARGEAGAFEPFEAVELGELADAAAGALGSRHPSLDLSVRLPDEPVPVLGSPTGLRLLVDNLLENAALHGGGHVALTVEPGARLIVDDDGPGVPVAERERIFERFARGAAAHGSGSGLGLAIAHQQARLHLGTLTVGDSPLGGARFSLAVRSGRPPRRS